MKATLLFYRRMPSPLHVTRAGVGAMWAAALSLATLLLDHPLALLTLLIAVLGAGLGAGVGRLLMRSMRLAAIVWLPIVAINVLVSRDGLTVFARLGDLGPFGQGNLTLEAVVFGGVIALKVMLLILITTLASLTVDPDEALRILRRLSFRSALTASLAARMIPVLAADAQRLAEAQRTRPNGDPRRRPRPRGDAARSGRRIARPGDGRGGNARGAGLRHSQPGAANPRGRGRVTTSPSSPQRSAILALAVARKACRRGALRRLPAAACAHRARRRSSCAWRLLVGHAASLRRSPRGGPMSAPLLSFERVDLPLPGR